MGGFVMTDVKTELSTDVKFQVDYEPSVIKIKNEKQLETLVAATKEKYGNQVFSKENFKEAKEARATLNKIVEMIDEERKKVEKGYTKPLDTFKSTINEYKNQIKGISESINTRIRELEEEDKKERKLLIEKEIESVAKENGVSPDAIQILATWLNANAFTDAGKLTKKTSQSILTEVVKVNQLAEQQEQSRTVVKSYAEAKGLDASSWLVLVEEGLTAAQIFPKIDQASKEKLEAEEQKTKHIEQELKQSAPGVSAPPKQISDEEPVVPEKEERTYRCVLTIDGTLKQLATIKKAVEQTGAEYTAEMEQ